jgi:hypothetical protein
MPRSLWASSGLICLALASAPAIGADAWENFWHRVHVDFCRNNSWPEPFQTADRAAAREPWCIQTDNGWKMQNTVGTFLFDRETQRLNQAGELLVKWIVTQAPQHRRAVFVLRGETPEATTARSESVQAAVAKYANECGCVCPVLLTCVEPTGWPASYIDSITQQFNATIPAPRLPQEGGGGASGGSGGGGSGGASQ